MDQGMIFDIKRFAVHDGPGIRTTVFFKGCPLNCLWCHNPESISPEIQEIERAIRLDGREFNKLEQVGKKYTVAELFAEIKRDKIYYEESAGGVTFSGGEPLLQADFLAKLLTLCKRNKIHSAVDTCGYCSEKDLLEVLPYVDLFLFDLKVLNNELHKKFTGVSNLQIINNLKLLVKKGCDIIIRIPVIPGFTDSQENMKAIAELLASFKHSFKIHLLPYHNTAKHKYEKLGREDNSRKIGSVSLDKLEELGDFFLAQGFELILGG